MKTGVRPRAAAVAAVCLAVAASRCTGGPAPPPDVVEPALDIFLVAADRVPGGALLGVWVSPRPDGPAGANSSYDQVGYLVGGVVGVDPATLPPQSPAGRLMGYDGEGHFVTLCTADRPLWAVYGEAGRVYAAGDGGRVLRYQPATHACERLSIEGVAPGDAPRFRGIVGTGASPAEMYLVGEGGREPAAGNLYRFDGATLVRVAVPAGLEARGLYGVAYDPMTGFRACGERATVLRKPPGDAGWSADQGIAAGVDEPLAGVSIEAVTLGRWSMMVGGAGRALVLARRIDDAVWDQRLDPIPPGQAALRGVYTASSWEVYMVGTRGTSLVFNGESYYAPPRTRVASDLLGVSGRNGIILAVGGDVTNATASQTGVILVRGDDYPAYTVDQVSFARAGSTRQNFGGGPGGQR